MCGLLYLVIGQGVQDCIAFARNSRRRMFRTVVNLCASVGGRFRRYSSEGGYLFSCFSAVKFRNSYILQYVLSGNMCHYMCPEM